jgi:3,4-dihydroxy 2-butanone 4-phosphate synthase/GTP cyclohydrolase II
VLIFEFIFFSAISMVAGAFCRAFSDPDGDFLSQLGPAAATKKPRKRFGVVPSSRQTSDKLSQAAKVEATSDCETISETTSETSPATTSEAISDTAQLSELAECGASEAVTLALAAIRNGEFVIIVDNQGATTQCTLAIAAEHATTERTAFMIRQSAGTVHACLTMDRLEGFGLHPASGTSGKGAALYESTNFLPGVTTGISAQDRGATLRALCDSSNPSHCFAKSGHVAPLCIMAGGVLDCTRHAEACYDLCRLCDLQPVGALAELMNEDGSMFTCEDARAFGEKHSISVVGIDQLVAHRRMPRRETGGSGVQMDSESKMWIDDIEAECMIRVYRCSDAKIEIVTVSKGDLTNAESVPARVHSECFTGDIIGSKRCDCGQQLHNFLRILNTKERGVLMYVRGHEGRGIGLANKIRAYKLQDEGFDTVDANLKLGLPVDNRTYEDALAVLRDLGIKTIQLYTNNPEKVQSLACITKSVAALASVPNEYNEKYLKTKRERTGHRTILTSFKLPAPELDTAKVKIGVVYTKWNEFYVDSLLKAALGALDNAGVQYMKLEVPGATELISGARAMIKKSKPHAVIVLGVLMKGSSDVYEVNCNSVMTGLSELNAIQDIPVTIGLLMCRDEDQAYERSHGASNPAKAWAETALHMAAISMDANVGLDEDVDLAF